MQAPHTADPIGADLYISKPILTAAEQHEVSQCWEC